MLTFCLKGCLLFVGWCITNKIKWEKIDVKKKERNKERMDE